VFLLTLTGACVDDVSVWGFLMSEVAHFRARVAGVAKNCPGDAAALAAARRDLAAANVSKALAGQRARLGLPPLPGDFLGALSDALLADAGPVAA
jgi:hypothetical protein